ncbi:MAG: FHA domain-containing protein [Hyphomicrobium sp.]|nr:FHA domain-containing protein [Hyphomicrobium sp.]OJU22109.1 MAG: hypothetical protein BGN89_00140 [Alphaproteobacteria bacterium 64-6]
MTNETPVTGSPDGPPTGSKRAVSARPSGSLREALIAAGRDDARITKITERSAPPETHAETTVRVPPPLPAAPAALAPVPAAEPARVIAAKPALRPANNHVEVEVQSTADDPISSPPRTQLVRGRSTVKRTEFHQDPVVGWLVIVGGPGLGAFRPIYEGNNTIGRGATQRIPLNFGDEAISNEEQAYLRYDSVDRKFLLVPNLAKTNIISVNEKKPTSAVELSAMDLITVGRTQLAFVPFCGGDFDWSELNDLKG